MIIVKNDDARLLSIAVAAERLGVSHHTLRAWLRQRRLEHVRLGRRVLVSQEAVDRFIADNVVPARTR